MASTKPAAAATVTDPEGREVVLLARIWEDKISRDHPELVDHLEAVIETVAQWGIGGQPLSTDAVKALAAGTPA